MELREAGRGEGQDKARIAVEPLRVLQVYDETIADGDGLRRVAMSITAKTGAACCTLAPGGQGLAYALASAPGGDLRETCKALNAAYQGRGGGKPGFCQGSLASGSFEQVKDFLLNTL